jgi:hypothetical protein
MKRALQLAVVLVIGFGTVAQAGTITLVYAVTVTSWCSAGGSCSPYAATFPLTVTFDDQETGLGVYYNDPGLGISYITRYFGVPTISGSPLPVLANPYVGVEQDSSYSLARNSGNPYAVGGWQEGRLHSGRIVTGGPEDQWEIGTQLYLEGVPAAFPKGNPDMPTAESLVALLNGTVNFRQYGWLLNEDGEGEGVYYGTATPVPDPGSSLLLLGIGLVGLRAFRKRW